jgi:uncharacterized protein (DUF3820 family)
MDNRHYFLHSWNAAFWIPDGRQTAEHMTDSCLMPFGKHSGTAMANVPASYLLWFWNQNKDDFEDGKFMVRDKYRVMTYIKDNLEDLRKEAS